MYIPDITYTQVVGVKAVIGHEDQGLVVAHLQLLLALGEVRHEYAPLQCVRPHQSSALVLVRVEGGEVVLQGLKRGRDKQVLGGLGGAGPITGRQDLISIWTPRVMLMHLYL